MGLRSVWVRWKVYYVYNVYICIMKIDMCIIFWKLYILDDNECDFLGKCSQYCINIKGLFKCICDLGYEFVN